MIPNEHQQVILVQAPNGAFLPGGEIEPGESKEETIKRELVEEVGFAGKIASYLGRRLIILLATSRNVLPSSGLFLFDD